MVRTKKSNIHRLKKALAYLGEPDHRLDLYRLFGIDLPTESADATATAVATGEEKP
jgi:hypothetical protein